MKPQNLAMLVSLLQALKEAAEGASPKDAAKGASPKEDISQKDSEVSLDSMREKLKQAAADAPYFNRFPNELHFALQEIVHPPTPAGESLLIACVWLAKQEEQLEEARRKIDLLEKRGSTAYAQLSGQRDRMHTIERTAQDINSMVTSQRDYINSSDKRTNMRLEALEKLVIGGAKGEDERCDPAIPTPIGTKRSDNV